MTAVSGLQFAKHKSVYGKKTARAYNTTNITAFFDEDEDELAAAQSTAAHQPSVKTTHPVKRMEATRSQGHTLKPVKPRIKRQDTFDVPSSSDDEGSPPPKRVAPLKWKSAVPGDTDTSGTQFTLRGGKRPEASQSSKSAYARRQRTPEVSPEAQLKYELRQATLSPESMPRTPKSNTSVSPRTSNLTSPDTAAEPGIASAKARLAARRKLVESNAPSSADECSEPARAVPKRAVLVSDESESTPRKRARTETTSEECPEDVHMADADEVAIHDISRRIHDIPANDANVYDFPESSEDELKASKPRVKSPKALSKPSRRGKLPTYKPRSLHSKGSSAPSRLAEMIATDTDTTAPSTRSPSESPSLTAAPHPPSTPPPGRLGSPATAIKSNGTMTPKQAQLWDRLLPIDQVAPSPSALTMKDLTISGRRRAAAPQPVAKLAKSQSDVPKRRLRMVDRLKASAPSSDNDSSVEGSADTDMADGEPDVPISGPTLKSSSNAKNAPPQLSRSQSQSESQSQSQALTSKSSLKTYASGVRTHLDDSIDEIMFGLTDEPSNDSQPSSQSSKRQISSVPQKSAFDLDESDDDGIGNGGIRTIHELRAAGSHTRGMWDIDEALEDITQHAPSRRGRRRTALMDLATKLVDKAFVSRFVGQSCELRLAAECGACSDEIADFILAATMWLLLATDPPDHTIQSLHDQGVVTWLAQMLGQDTAINKLAKDRRNNMSKASQSSLLEFSDMLTRQSYLWSEDKPQVVSPRLIALKGLDQFTRRLRRLGDRSELLRAEELSKVPRGSGEAEHSNQVDLELSISLLESLSTASLSIHWPTSVLEHIRSILPNLKTTSPPLRHVQFLALRLCLNLTNDNESNCALLTGSPSDSTVRFLLGAIQSGYTQLATESDDEKRTVALDLLVLAIGIMINLAEHCNEARSLAVLDSASLAALVEVFKLGQKHMLDAESVEESISNVTFGYLAVMLANLCPNHDARSFIASKLPGQSLGMLIEAVEEFVRHHQKVDTMNFDGDEGKEVWGAFTEKLKGVLARLKEVERGVTM